MSQATPEVLFTDAQRRASVLAQRSARYAASGDVVRAVAAAWGADVATVQMAMWESVMVTSLAPQQHFFALAQTLTAAIGRASGAAGDQIADAEAVAVNAREAVLAELEPALRAAAVDRLPSLDHLRGLPVPGAADYARARDDILTGHVPAAFAKLRREQSEQERRTADERSAAGDVAGAIEHDYRAVLLGVEGYLVGSADAAGDSSLLTVLLRWDTVVAAIGAMPGLPNDRSGARQAILSTVAQALGPADTTRLLDWLAH